MGDNDNILAELIKVFGEKFAYILNKVLNRDELKRVMQEFFSTCEDIANGTLKPDKEFIQGMIDIYTRNPADIPESVRDYVRELAESENTDTHPVIKATTHVVKSLAFEVTKAGRDLRNEAGITDFYEYECSLTTRKSNKKKKVKPVDTVITLNFKAIEEWESYLLANKQITRMDIIRAIHASALFAAGNQVVSSDMILRQMNGGKDLQTTPAQRKEIQDSFARLGQTWITIDASQEVKSGLNTERKFKGALLPCGMIIGDVILNGQPAHDCIRIYDTSPLIKYAIAKGQASPILIGMFNIPGLNATDENTELIDYLIRIYASAINPHSPVKPVILYDKIYEYLGVDGSNQQVIYNKKAKIRKAVRKIFTAWKEMKFIKDFHELTADNNPVKAGTKAVKVILDLYTLKEFNEIHKNELGAV